MILGLTGGIASGKSTVSRVFAELGAEIIDADIIAKEVSGDKVVLDKIAREFGEKAVANDEMDRKYVADIIFTNPAKREKLNQIIHPAVIAKIKSEIASKKDKGLVIVDVPLLYEVKFEDEVEKVLVVYIDKNTQIQRLMSRDDISEEKALARINSQMQLEEKAEKADIIIKNNETIEKLKEKVRKLYNKLN